ncbi:MAG: peptidase M48 Ste24p, partial [Desulfocapsa sp.]
TIFDAIIASSTGTRVRFGQVGAQIGQLKYSPAYEHEADYIGLYIMARAGYKIDNAAEVWRRMSAIAPDAIYVKTTHPTNPARFVAMKKTIAEIKSKKIIGLKLIPNFKKEEG